MIKTLSRQLDADKIQSVYVLVGGGATTRDKAYDMIQHKVVEPDALDLNMMRFDGSQHGADDIIVALQTVPLLGATRLIYVRRFDQLVAADQNAVAELVAKGIAGVVLVLSVDKLEANRVWVKTIKPHATVIRDAAPAGGDLVRWMMDVATEMDAQLPPDAAQLLMTHVGTQTDILRGELEKLATFVGPGQAITIDDVMTVTAANVRETIQGEIFQFCDAVAAGRTGFALTSMDALLGNGTHHLVMATMLGRHFRQLLAVKSYGGQAAQPIARELGLNPRAVSNLLRQGTSWTLPRIEEAVLLLAQAEMQLKRGPEPRSTLERVVVQLSTLPGRASYIT